MSAPDRHITARTYAGRLARRLVLRGSLAATCAAGLAAALSVVCIGLDEEASGARRVPVRVAIAAPAEEPVVTAPARATPSDAWPAGVPRVVCVPRLTRGGAQASETVIEPQAMHLEVAELHRLERVVHGEGELVARLERLDELAACTSPRRMIALLERLLDRPVGGTADEVQSLKVALLARLGRYRDDLQAERRLLDVARNPRAPRGERLTAIGALRFGGAIQATVQPALERLASEDPDGIVRQRARWALGQQG